MSAFRHTWAGVLSLLATAAVAPADVITMSGTGSRTGTGTFAVPVAQFNPAWGTLTSVTLTGYTFTGGSRGVENTDPAAPNVISMTHDSTVCLNLPDGGTYIPDMVLNLAGPNTAVSLPAFDGVIDFGGTSGMSVSNLSAASGVAVMTLTGQDVLPFLGSGTVALEGVTSNRSFVSGSGNTASTFLTNAGASVSVTYNFSPNAGITATPEPASLVCFAGLLAVGLGLGLRKRFA